MVCFSIKEPASVPKKKIRLLQSLIVFCIIPNVIIVGMSVRTNRLLKENPWGQVSCGEHNARIKHKTIQQYLI